MNRAPRQVRKSVHEPALRPRSRTLRAGVLAVFPWAKRDELERWESRVRVEAGKAPEPLLFVALLAGTRFRVFHLEAASVLAELHEWLTSRPSSMNKALADIVVDAMSSAIERVVRARGWQRGADGAHIEIKGRPPDAPGAWLAATLIEGYLVAEEVSSRLARELGRDAAGVLLGRRVAQNQYSAARKMVMPHASELIARILDRYCALVTAEGGRRLEPEPPESDRLAHAKWLAKHRRLLHTLTVSGSERVAKDALSAIPQGAWPNFSLAATPRKPRSAAAATREPDPRDSSTHRRNERSKRGAQE